MQGLTDIIFLFLSVQFSHYQLSMDIQGKRQPHTEH